MTTTYVHLVGSVGDAFARLVAAVPPETELYLGLMHAQDGVPGTRRRMAVASKYVQGFGIASECGISRARDERVALEFMRVYGGAAAAGRTELAPAGGAS